MKALTICQPYAELIIRREKRIENRTWPTSYRGPMYIHAGKSRQWLGEGDLERFPNMPFGAVVGIATLFDCVQLNNSTIDRYPWIADHEHAHGPWCWLLVNVVPIGPWPWRGAQGLFDIDEDELGRVANRELGIPEPAEAHT